MLTGGSGGGEGDDDAWMTYEMRSVDIGTSMGLLKNLCKHSSAAQDASMTPMAIAQMTCDEILEEAGTFNRALIAGVEHLWHPNFHVWSGP